MRALLTRLSAARKDQRAPARDIDPHYLARLLRACGQAGAAARPDPLTLHPGNLITP
jgi:hypothetical protein